MSRATSRRWKCGQPWCPGTCSSLGKICLHSEQEFPRVMPRRVAKSRLWKWGQPSCPHTSSQPGHEPPATLHVFLWLCSGCCDQNLSMQ